MGKSNNFHNGDRVGLGVREKARVACSHRRHGQDKTILSSLVCVGGVNTIGDKTRQFFLVSNKFPICNCSVSNIGAY